MDSGNSGSLQSSSGGDEDYDSRTESISSFLNPSFHFPQISSSSNQPPPPPPQHPPPLSLHPNQPQQLPPTFFDHNPNPFSHSSNPNSSNPIYNLDLPLWHHHQRSDHPNYTNDANNNPPSVLLPSSSNQSLIRPPQRPNLGAGGGSGPSSSVPLPDNNNNNQATTVKTSRKRTRASRRAPTTVLTTDTSNFRQMVQEFTGIPAPPFSATAVSPYSRRFDIFSSALRSSSGGPMEALSPLFNHPFRPSAQKPQHPLSNSISGPASSTFQINPSDLGFLSKNPLNPQNNFPLQTLLQDPNSLKYTQSTTSSLGELGLPHDHVSGNLAAFPGLAPPEDQGPHLGSYGTSGYNHNNNNKVNGSDFNPEKRLENSAAQRNGGTADPWVCSSD
ncbi:probable serine/threonine-protein kinase mkcB [Impatiens glandulifera]|uniref:probable serine/threonine-protein kinase mkcB n=1 Tax=Impatiens glandulifera TaxID=253017 RepID=UPI001FB13A0F|nr:probable serine/threonine-protein kinase mkcB [Impatiens glandulifera]